MYVLSFAQLYIIRFDFCSAKLKDLKEEEIKAEYFTHMPSNHYMEIATLLLNW